jgi:GAF domain-containing protein
MDNDLHNPHNYLMIRLPVKWMVFFILGISLIAGVVTIAVRFEHLHYLAATYYHPYLVRAGFSDNFYVWYLLLPEILLALSFAATGAIIALHRPATWMTIFVAIALILFGVSVPPPLHALVVQQGALALPLQLLHYIGLALFIIFFYVFPDGRFVPRWTQICAIALVGWAVLCPFFPVLNPYQLPRPFPFVVLSGLLFTGVAAQLYRYFRLTAPDQQQQTKWVVFGITISVLGDFITHIPWYLWSLEEGPDWQILFLHHPFFIASQLLVPLSIGVSISRFGLWEIDFIINQTLIYGLLMTLVAAGWATIAKMLELLFSDALGESAAPLATGLAVLVVGLAFGTTRKYLETLVNHYFFPSKVNPSRDFVEFLPEARSTIGSSELLEILLYRTLERFKITHGVVLLGNIEEEQPQLVSVGDIEPETVELLEWDDQLLNQIHQGSVMRRPNDQFFPLLVPLVLRRTKQPELLGVLALGPLKNGRQYSLNELWMFKQLASQAGTAIYISQLNAANYQTLKQKINILEQRITSLSEEITQGHE